MPGGDPRRFFFVSTRMLSAGIDQVVAYVPLFTVAVVLLVVLLIAGHIAAAIMDRPENPDERDRVIGWRAESNSSWILGLGVLTAVAGMVLAIDTVWIANWLIFTLFVSEISKLVFQLLYYRRGMRP